MESSKKQEKRNVVLALALLLLLLIGSVATITYSKYISKNPATVTAEIAKWDFSSAFKHNGTTTTTLNLGSTVSKDTLKNGKIAPGTEGSFDVEINAGASETDIIYNVTVENETTKPSNLYFKVLGSDTKYTTLEDAITGAGLDEGRINYDSDVKSISKTIEWHWDYETVDGDTADTQDGINANDYSFSITITGTQADPSVGRN